MLFPSSCLDEGSETHPYQLLRATEDFVDLFPTYLTLSLFQAEKSLTNQLIRF